MLTKKFQQLKKSDTGIAGGKGASLGELTNAGIPVPPGFVILTDAFETFLDKTDLKQDIRSELNNVDKDKVHTVEKTSENIQALILNAKIPELIKKEITKEFKKLGTKFVAVRSSATAEDGLDHAWAGQLDSFLNVRKDNLLESIQKCWASLFTPRAIFYRFEKGLEDSHISVAVVVQTMVDSKKSGIAFSVHPVTEDGNQMIIEAGFGLGEAIVSGSITPDAYVVSKKDNKIIDVNINNQAKALFRKNGGDNEWKDLDKKGEKQVLNKKEILELGKLIKKIENHYGVPQDIEWAQENGAFFITQSRPITTLKKKNDTKQIKEEYRKIMTRPLSIANCELWDTGERLEMPKQFKNLLFFDPLFIYTPGKAVSIYYNFTDPKQNLQPLIDYLENNLEWFQNKKNIFDNVCQKIRKAMKNNLQDIKKLIILNNKIWPMIAVANALGSTEYYKTSKKLKNLCIQIRNESDDVLHSLLTYINKVLNKKLKIESKNILLSEFLNNKIPHKNKLTQRNSGWLYHKGRVYIDAEKYSEKNNINFIHSQKTKGSKKIKGNIAYKGRIKGKIKIVFELDDLKNVKKDNILVTPMTTPDMIPVLKKVSAIITDEGGITCHAAIVARELKKPCIIGTKIATQVLCDGDLVEVDGNKGIANILKRIKKFPSIDYYDYQHFTNTKGKVSFEGSYGFMYHVKDLGGLVLYNGFNRRTFISKKKMKQSLVDGDRLYSKKYFLDELEKGIKENFDKSLKEIKDIEKNGLTKKTLANFVQYIDESSRFYRFTDFFYTDKYFSKHQLTKSFIKKFERIKLEGRHCVNETVYKNNSLVNRLLIQVAKKFHIDKKNVSEYSMPEIFALFDGKLVEESIISKRKKAHVCYADKNENIKMIFGDDALRFIKSFDKQGINSKILKGVIASPGIVKGRAHVIHISTDDFDSIAKARKNVKKGEVLVTDSTIPEIIDVCNKVNAIITNQGGMMSHAAIVSRELNIPCIVGVENATEKIKTGDKLLVDADQGIIKILKKPY